jgi:hypothetical protein
MKTETQRTTRRSAPLLAVLLTSALLAACASSETGDDTGTGGSSATGGSGTGGANGTGGLTGTGGEHSTGGNPGSGGSGTGGLTGTGGFGTGGSGTGGGAGARGTGGSGTGGNGTGGNGTGGTGTGGMAGAKGTGGMAGAKGTGGVAGGNGTGGTAGIKGTGGAAGGSSGSYKPCPTNGDPCKVLPLGDSITFGINYEGSYRVELFKKAVTASQNITFVGTQTNGPAMAPGTTVPFPQHHEGWSGYTIAQIQGKAAGDVTSAPHMILVHAGTNDTYMSDPGGAPARLSTLVDYLTTNFSNALVVVAKIIPYPAQTSNVNLINNSIPAMVQSKAAAGKHVISVDLNTGFQTSTMLSSDGIHPNQTGYNWMGDTWYATVSSYFP